MITPLMAAASVRTQALRPRQRCENPCHNTLYHEPEATFEKCNAIEQEDEGKG
jgi:hypothetical protein